MDLLPYADHIVVLGDGCVADNGSYHDIRARNPELFTTFTSIEEESEDELKISTKQDVPSQKLERPGDEMKNKENGKSKNGVSILQRNGTLGVYQYYIHRAGPYVCLAAVGVLIIQAFTAEYASELSSCSGSTYSSGTDVL